LNPLRGFSTHKNVTPHNSISTIIFERKHTLSPHTAAEKSQQ
jgi:hypothetical protein